MSNRPLFPADGMLYDLAMMEAQKEYDAWVKSRKGKKGITVYAVRSTKLEETDATIQD